MDLEGRRVWDSTAIIAALEEFRPDPPLYPADPAARERALELEDYFDEQLAPRVRRLLWHHTLPDTDAAVDAVLPDESSLKRGFMRRTAPIAEAMVRRDYSVDADSAAEATAGIRAAMDRLESELGGGEYLAGGSFSVADLAGAALFTPLLAPAGRPWAPRLVEPLRPLRAELEARPGGRWVELMYERHRGVPVAA
jgi:glutathione S-transferase